ncbi:MAG: tetraacyldisaccharide 4'-kinase [Holosporales bacterium]|nr:tetraacyldisaccharide 4'-kinase [Holosporales bacterium]
MFRFVVSPKFWKDKDSRIAKFLAPFSKLYRTVSDAKMHSVVPTKASVPVICVGNVVLGGAGKTPTVSLICSILKENSKNPHILTAGYGGYLKNVVKVDPQLHSYLQVGDEALLSVKVAPTWIGKNRVNSGKAAVSGGADVLVMDDGFQNNSLEKDFRILVVDSGQEFGNEMLFPAGPLRESVDSGIKKSNIVLIIGEKNLALESRIHRVDHDIPICYAKMEVVNANVRVESGRVIGFCGLGYPEKFRRTLIDCGYEVMDFVEFSDHHPYTITEVQKLIDGARSVGASLITTMKDYVKIPDVFKKEMHVIEIALKPENGEFAKFLLSALQN